MGGGHVLRGFGVRGGGEKLGAGGEIGARVGNTIGGDGRLVGRRLLKRFWECVTGGSESGSWAGGVGRMMPDIRSDSGIRSRRRGDFFFFFAVGRCGTDGLPVGEGGVGRFGLWLEERGAKVPRAKTCRRKVPHILQERDDYGPRVDLGGREALRCMAGVQMQTHNYKPT